MLPDPLHRLQRDGGIDHVGLNLAGELQAGDLPQLIRSGV
jgi:hypothetical protein